MFRQLYKHYLSVFTNESCPILTQTGPSTFVNTYLSSNRKVKQATSKMMLDRLPAVVLSIGEDRLGYKITEIGTHSIRSGAAAMAMYT
jgi:hypothetical protein